MKIVLFFLVLIVLFFTWKNLSVPSNTGIVNGKLSPCPWTPNCVNSNATNKPYAIAPLPYVSEDTIELIQDYLLKHYNAKVLQKSSNYLHIVVSTHYLRFKDDLEFLVDPDKRVVSVRSASRVGYSDLNMNRIRIEKLRQYLTTLKKN